MVQVVVSRLVSPCSSIGKSMIHDHKGNRVQLPPQMHRKSVIAKECLMPDKAVGFAANMCLLRTSL